MVHKKIPQNWWCIGTVIHIDWQGARWAAFGAKQQIFGEDGRFASSQVNKIFILLTYQ
ncbi:MAG: hypothetical protein KH338_00975 [Oscillospiraceae bacterium]|nr:hypothetical protein [Oscillospiraceae bacterium]